MLLDAHAHLDRYENSLEQILDEITRHKIFTISNSMDLPSYERNLAIARKCDFVLPTFGVHPWRAFEYVDHLDELTEAIDKSPMLGEIGLDYYFVEDRSLFPAQRQIFEFFLKAAQKQNKIVNLHTKGAEHDILNLLDIHRLDRVIIHWYSGPFDIFHKMISRGCYFTIGVEILYSEHIKDIARTLPLELLLTETDNPGGYKWLAGTPGMPLILKDVIKAIADLRQMTYDEIVDTVTKNFKRLIDNDPVLEGTFSRLA